MVAYVAKATRNSSVDEIGERYRLNHAIVVQASDENKVIRIAKCDVFSGVCESI